MSKSVTRKLFIVRRESNGIGGAEKVAHRFMKSFSEFYDAEIIHAGKIFDGVQIRGGRGPSWIKCLRFALSVRNLLAKYPNSLILSMERGVPGTIYRAGDGVLRAWMEIKYKHSFKWIFNPLYWVLPILEAWSIKGSTHIVANSNMVSDEIKKHHDIKEDEISVIENGFNDRVYFPLNGTEKEKLKTQLDLKSYSMNLLFSGSGWDRKGLSVAISISAIILDKYPNSHFWIAGKGSPAKYKKIIKKKKLNNKITFLGSVKNISKWYQVCDLMVLPTRYDPFSNSCLEALACGCPVITSEKNGAKDIILRSNGGIIIPSGAEIKDNFKEQLFSLIEDQVQRKDLIDVSENIIQVEMNKYLKLLERLTSE